MRLDKFLIKTLQLTKQQRKRLLADHQILIDGYQALSLRQNIDSELQKITVRGQQIISPTEKYYMMYKPEGVICAVKDDQKQTVIDLLRAEDQIEGLYPIGRLDRYTSGLLLLTNNGPLGYRLLHPDHHVEKQYRVKVNGDINEETVALFARGVIIDQDTLCKPAKLIILRHSPTESEALVTISEGKYHQVKKMFLSAGVKVIELVRLTFGEFSLDQMLKPGEYRELNQAERQLIKQYLSEDIHV